MLTVYLLRHGETAYNADGNRYCGLTDIGLTERGVEQAKRAASFLKDTPIEAVYASPLQRAFTTAFLAIEGKIQIQKEERLKELDFGNWEGKTREEFVREDPELWNAWEKAPETARAGGTGNTGSEIVERVDAFFLEMLQTHRDRSIMVVAHNTVNRLYLAYKLGMPLRNYRRIVQENSAITLFELDNQGILSLHQLNTR